MAKNLMIQGTMSNAGKSLVAAGICRILHQDGYRVAPFKSQNMALNSCITGDGGEMSRAQVVQAEACGVRPDTRMNPILLKPNSDHSSKVVVNGRQVAVLPAGEYMKERSRLIPEVLRAYNSLAEESDIMVIEGAGSPVELNLNRRDIVNMGLAELVDAPVLLVGDIDRGGIFAQLYGTAALFRPEEKKRLKGLLINKFRGDLDLLRPGLATLEELCGVPVVGVIPHINVDVEDEDSLSDKLTAHKPRKPIDIVVMHLPHIACFSDYSPLELYDNVSVRYIKEPEDFGEPALAIIPGSTCTTKDLEWLRASGLADRLQYYIASGGLTIGICDGYQMLGEEILDPDHLETETIERIEGLGQLPIRTLFSGEKEQHRSTGRLGEIAGELSCLSGLPYDGYEIHTGRCTDQETAPVLRGEKNVYGTYVHSFFDHPEISQALVARLSERLGIPTDLRRFDLKAYKEQQYDLLADGVRQALDMDLLYRIIDRKV